MSSILHGRRSRGQSRMPAPQPQKLEVILPRTRYIPGSGPPLAPVGLLPPDDMDGIILDEFDLGDRRFRLLVTYQNDPQLKISVRPQNILDYVSALEYERWEMKKAQEEDIIELEKLALKRIKEKSRLAGKLAAESRIPKKSKSGNKPPGAFGKRKRRRGPNKSATRGPASTRQEVKESGDEIGIPTTFNSPKRSPTKQRGLADLPPEEVSDSGEETKTAMALDLQINGPRSINGSRLREEISRSTSPDPLSASKKSRSKAYPSSNMRSSSSGTPSAIPEIRRSIRSSSRPSGSSSALLERLRATRGSSAVSVSGSSQTKRQRSPETPLRDSVATSSSREAYEVYESLEKRSGSRHSPDKAKTIYQKYSSFKKRKVKSPSPEPIEAEVGEEGGVDDDNEFDVEALLDDELRLEHGKQAKYYLVKWAGYDEATWEPSKCITPSVKEAYNKKKRRLATSTSSMSAGGNRGKLAQHDRSFKVTSQNIVSDGEETIGTKDVQDLLRSPTKIKSPLATARSPYFQSPMTKGKSMFQMEKKSNFNIGTSEPESDPDQDTLFISEKKKVDKGKGIARPQEMIEISDGDDDHNSQDDGLEDEVQ